MTPAERELEFNYLFELVETGGSEETVHALLRANPDRAVMAVKLLLEKGALNDEAQVVAAWNLCQVEIDDSTVHIFIRFLTHSDPELRERAAYYVPVALCTSEVKSALKNDSSGNGATCAHTCGR